MKLNSSCIEVKDQEVKLIDQDSKFTFVDKSQVRWRSRLEIQLVDAKSRNKEMVGM